MPVASHKRKFDIIDSHTIPLFVLSGTPVTNRSPRRHHLPLPSPSDREALSNHQEANIHTHASPNPPVMSLTPQPCRHRCYVARSPKRLRIGALACNGWNAKRCHIRRSRHQMLGTGVENMP